MKANIMLTSFFAAVSLTAGAVEKPPVPGEPANFTVPDTTQFTLDNGLPVTLIPYGTTPKVLIRLYSKVGNAHDKVLGTADIVYQTMLEDGQKPSTQGSADKAAQFGGELDVEVTASYSYVSMNALGNYAPEAIALMGDMVNDYSPTQEAADRVRTSFLRNIEIQKSSAAGQASTAFNSTIYGDEHPYGKTWPEAESLNAVTVKDFQDFASNYVVGQNSHLYVSGVFDQEAVTRAIKQAFGSLAKGEGTTIPVPEAKGQGELVFVERPDAPQSTLRIGLPVITPADKDFTALSMMNTALGGSFGSRITSNIREDKGYTYSPYSALAAKPHSTLWYEAADVTAEHTADSVNEIIKEIKRMQTEDMMDDELQGFKNYVSGIFVLQNSSRAGVISQLWYHELYGLPVERLKTQVARINALTPADIKRVAQTYLKVPEMTLVVVGDKAVQEQLSEIKGFSDE